MAPPHDGPRDALRDATRDDLPLLATLRNTPHLHRQYLAEADGRRVRFLLFAPDGEPPRAFANLVLRPRRGSRRRAARSAAGAPRQGNPAATQFPRVSDLWVAADHRGRGIGSAFLRSLEREAIAAGGDRLYLSVDSGANPRALAWYRRLGYAPLGDPYRRKATFHREGGGVEERVYWRVDLAKALATPEP